MDKMTILLFWCSCLRLSLLIFFFLLTFAARVHFQPVPHYADCFLKVTSWSFPPAHTKRLMDGLDSDALTAGAPQQENKKLGSDD